MTAARSVGATFTIQRYTLTVTAPTHGTVSGTGITCGTGGADCTETFDYGTVVGLTATPDTGYDFGVWSGACVGTGPCSPTMTAARSVGATFTIQRYTLTVTAPTHGTVSGTGITCGTGGSDCTETFDVGTVVSLTATPDTGYGFGGWSGACAGTGACSVTMTAARSVGATFTIQRYTLTVTAPTHGTVSGTGITCGTGGSDCTETFDYGTGVSLTATPDTGYGLRAWTGACTGTGSCSVTLDADRTVGGLFGSIFQRKRGDPGTHTGPGFILNTPAVRPDAAPDSVAGPAQPLPRVEHDPPATAPGPEPKLEAQHESAPAPVDTVPASPPPPHVTVAGQVRNPGTYAWFPGMTARELIAAAGGPAPEVPESRLEIDRSGKRQSRIEPDEPLDAGETLVVRYGGV
jgi:hypothetical protein